jgi:hypothetical protein
MKNNSFKIVRMKEREILRERGRKKEREREEEERERDTY